MSDESTPKDVYQNNPPTVVLSFFSFGTSKTIFFNIQFIICAVLLSLSIPLLN